MTIRRLIFLVLFWSIFFLMHALVYATLAQVYGIWHEQWLWILILLSFSFILANILVRRFDGKLVDIFYYITASWLGVVFIFFSSVVFYEIVGIFVLKDSQIFLNIVLITAALSSVWALFHGKYLTIRELVIPVAGLEREVKIVHLSDIHIGTVHQEGFLKRIVEKTNALDPDFVLMTGDLFDGSEPIHEEMLKPLDLIKVPTYFSTGNHEEYEGLQNVRDTIKNLEMRLLDEDVVVQNGLQIIGVNDRQSIPKEITLNSILEKISFDASKPTILMYHTPVEWDAARKHGVDLMLSGHTHNGQIYPFNLLVRMQFKYLNGLYKQDGKYLHVSPGTGTWGPPMRLGSRNQITLLKLTPV